VGLSYSQAREQIAEILLQVPPSERFRLVRELNSAASDASVSYEVEDFARRRARNRVPIKSIKNFAD
jgi:hypothetical protein